MKTLLCTLLLAAWTSMAFGQFPPELVLYKLNGNALDYSGNQNHGTLLGPYQTSDHNNIFPQAYGFDGMDDFIEIIPTNEFNVPLPVTIVAWVRLDGGGLNCVFRSNHDPGRYSGFWMNINANQQVVAGYGDSGAAVSGHRRSKTGITSLQIGTWYHLAVVIRKPDPQGIDDMDIYINGVNDCGTYSGSGGTMLAIDTVGGTIGESSYWAPSGPVLTYFHGRIAEVRVYPNALSEPQVQWLAGVTGPLNSACCDLVPDFTPVYNGNLNFTFQNTSTGTNPWMFSWDFGDGTNLNTFGTPTNVNHTYAGPGTYDVCLTVQKEDKDCIETYCETVAIGAKGRFAERSTPTWSLFPNPTADKVQIQWTERSAEAKTLQILDMSGRIVQRQLLPQGNSAKVDVSSLPSGVYILQFDGSDQREKLHVIH
ncbi:MAG: LamG-like jellyroll fold domain-containing protein [Bacteroidota bacterium]